MTSEFSSQQLLTNAQHSLAKGIYIHIPFCIKKCPYCNFYSITDLSYINDFTDAIVKEIGIAADKNFICDTVYFGGGTPTVLGVKKIDTILSAVHKNFALMPNSEITIEANPGTVSKESLLSLKTAGFNRINFGVQSFCDLNLKFLERIHTAKEGLHVYEQARKVGFENIGIDLIYGICNQSLEMFF